MHYPMPLHPVSDYLDVIHTPFPRLFEGIGEVWEALPRIGPFLKEWLEPSVEGDIRGDIHIEGPVFIGPGAQIMHGAVLLGPVYIGAGISALSATMQFFNSQAFPMITFSPTMVLGRK